MSFVFQDLKIINHPDFLERKPPGGWFNSPVRSRNPRQLVWLTYWLDARLFGIDADAWRRSSMALHMMASALLIFLSPMAALLLLLHPLTVMSSSYAAGRSGLISGLFQMLIAGTAIYGFYVVALLLSTVALLWVKEDSIIFFPMICILWWLR